MVDRSVLEALDDLNVPKKLRVHPATGTSVAYVSFDLKSGDYPVSYYYCKPEKPPRRRTVWDGVEYLEVELTRAEYSRKLREYRKALKAWENDPNPGYREFMVKGAKSYQIVFRDKGGSDWTIVGDGKRWALDSWTVKS